MKLLVVDDSASDIELLRSVLESVVPIEMIRLTSGSAAMDWLARPEWSACDVVLIDWRLPGVSGHEVARAFLSSKPDPRIPIAVLSSPLPPQIKAELHGWGAVVLDKPADLEGYYGLAQGIVDLARCNKTASPAIE